MPTPLEKLKVFPQLLKCDTLRITQSFQLCSSAAPHSGSGANASSGNGSSSKGIQPEHADLNSKLPDRYFIILTA